MIVAPTACAVVLPGLVGQDVNLTIFTGNQASPAVRPDLASVLIPLAGLVAVAVVALAREVRSGRGRGVKDLPQAFDHIGARKG